MKSDLQAIGSTAGVAHACRGSAQQYQEHIHKILPKLKLTAQLVFQNCAAYGFGIMNATCSRISTC